MPLRVTNIRVGRGAEKTFYETTDKRVLAVRGIKDSEIKINNILQDTIKRIRAVKQVQFRIPRIVISQEGNVLMERLFPRYHFKIGNKIDFFDARYQTFASLDMPQTWKEHTLPERYRIKYMEAIGEFLAVLKYNDIFCQEYEILVEESDDKITINMIDFDQCYKSSLFDMPTIKRDSPFFLISDDQASIYETILINRYDETSQILNTI